VLESGAGPLEGHGVGAAVQAAVVAQPPERRRPLAPQVPEGDLTAG